MSIRRQQVVRAPGPRFVWPFARPLPFPSPLGTHESRLCLPAPASSLILVLFFPLLPLPPRDSALATRDFASPPFRELCYWPHPATKASMRTEFGERNTHPNSGLMNCGHPHFINRALTAAEAQPWPSGITSCSRLCRSLSGSPLEYHPARSLRAFPSSPAQCLNLNPTVRPRLAVTSRQSTRDN